MTDQYTFQNPVTAYEKISPPEQHQPEPGLDAELAPKADLGEDTYRGTSRLEGPLTPTGGCRPGGERPQLGTRISVSIKREIR